MSDDGCRRSNNEKNIGAQVTAVDVLPRVDVLVMFRADRMVHEVRPTYAKRLATTIWFNAGSRHQKERISKRLRSEAAVAAPCM